MMSDKQHRLSDADKALLVILAIATLLIGMIAWQLTIEVLASALNAWRRA